MRALTSHTESHLLHRVGWLRAAVLGANDGIVSTASLIVGVAAAGSGPQTVLVAGIAGLLAGALSMAAGESISVQSQADTEDADLARERRELATAPEAELAELSGIYRARGLSPELAETVARELTAGDPLAAHARDELGITDISTARPVQAALASATTFAAGAALPLAAILVAPAGAVIPVTATAALLALAVLGYLGARAGGVPPLRPVLRVAFWGALAMAVTTAVGSLFGVAA
jgi:vacuolar iron transporter family protein